jgi:2-C-methyl-D-erythritol 4-phosphate cytidylyltransferase
MGSDKLKQFLQIGNKPILMHTFQRFIDYAEKIEIILVLPNEQIPLWENLCQEYQFNCPHQIASGGKTRFESVRNGLDLIPTEGLVAIHDGVRPFITRKIIEATFTAAEKAGNGIASVPLKDSIRSIKNNTSATEDRNNFRIIQTPQTFQVSLIKKAFSNASHTNFTDDASVLEAFGEKIELTEGSYANIKITTPEDLTMAEAILQNFRY